jgi:hypothetical protein
MLDKRMQPIINCGQQNGPTLLQICLDTGSLG